MSDTCVYGVIEAQQLLLLLIDQLELVLFACNFSLSHKFEFHPFLLFLLDGNQRQVSLIFQFIPIG